jgi:hypothetical protein
MQVIASLPTGCWCMMQVTKQVFIALDYIMPRISPEFRKLTPTEVDQESRLVNTWFVNFLQPIYPVMFYAMAHGY